MKLRVLSESSRPCYGIYYWIPVNGSWELYPLMREALAFGDGEFNQGRPLLHRYFWEDAVAPELGLSGEMVYAYLGLPRGRVSIFGKQFEIAYAETPGGKRGLEKVRAAFFVPPSRVEYVYDKHMKMSKQDHDLIMKAIKAPAFV